MNLTREGFLQILVLNEVADDFENLDKLIQECKILAVKFGLTVDDTEVVRTLAQLISVGLMRAVWLSTTEPVRWIEGLPSEQDWRHVYFMETEEGRQHHSGSYWPLDECGNPRQELSVDSSSI